MPTSALGAVLREPGIVNNPGHRAPLGDPFTGHTRSVNAVAIGQLEGRTVIVSGGNDRTVRVWNLPDRTSRHTTAAVDSAVIDLASQTLAIALREGHHIVATTEAGIVCLRMSASPAGPARRHP